MVVSLGLRALRWVFLLRRAGVRIPIRDAYIGYFSGLSVSVPPLIGEVAVRASVYRTRNAIPLATTCVVNLWERSLDLVAAAAIFGWAAGAAGPVRGGVIAALLIVAASLIGAVRSAGLSMLLWISNRVARAVDGVGTEVDRTEIARLAGLRAWSIALATSVTAWLVPAMGLWGLSVCGILPFHSAQPRQSTRDRAASSSEADAWLRRWPARAWERRPRASP